MFHHVTIEINYYLNKWSFLLEEESIERKLNISTSYIYPFRRLDVLLIFGLVKFLGLLRYHLENFALRNNWVWELRSDFAPVFLWSYRN